MPQYIDCYFLINSRKSIFVEAFLNKFIPIRTASAEDYPVPEYTNNPARLFLNTTDLILYLEEKSTYSYSIYWRNEDQLSDIKHGMVFYTTDGMMIFGVSIEEYDPNNDIYKAIKTFTGSTMGCMTVEEAPPDNYIEFNEFCHNRKSP
jgi:hypothetical protein